MDWLVGRLWVSEIDTIVSAHLPLSEIMGMWAKGWWLQWEFWMDILGQWPVGAAWLENMSKYHKYGKDSIDTI
jgi:hypothetical protein